MENIELSNQSSKRSKETAVTMPDDHDTTTKNIYKNEHEGDNMTATSSQQDMHHSRQSIIPEAAPTPVTKKSFGEHLKAKLPPFPLMRTIVKASVAILISMIFVFVDQTRNAVGSGNILVVIGTLLSFPFRPIGVQLEASFQSLFGALVGSAWCFLGMYLANLARDPAIATPVQPNSSAVLTIFMLIGVFGLTYLRTRVPQANFATIFASIITAFALTQASITPGFQPIIVYTFLKPIAMAAAIALMVDMLLWPDDSITKYMGVLNKSLKEYNSFYQEHTNAFLEPFSKDASITLPTLHARLQNSILTLINCKREVQREVLFNRLSHKDISNITRIVKQMRDPLHGIGLSLISKTDRVTDIKKPYFASVVDEEPTEYKKEFLVHLEEMKKVAQELSDTCVLALGECNDRLMKFSGKPRSLKSTLLWPFPRIFLSDYYKSKNAIEKEQQEARSQSLSQRLDQVIAKYHEEQKKSKFFFIEPDSKKFEDRFNSLLQIIYLFQFNLVEHANHLRSLVVLVESIEATRTSRRFWLPRLSLAKWFRSTGVDPHLGTQIGSVDSQAHDSSNDGINDMHNANSGGNDDLGLTQTMTRPDLLNVSDDVELTGLRNTQGTVFPRDPDVNPPDTAFELVFYNVHKYTRWMKSMEAAFALKTAGGYVLLSLPAFLPQSASWFFAWRGQWATITLMMWMFPMAGMFLFTVVLRVIGTVAGGVLGIIVWEIARGNTYGLAVLSFFVMWPLYYLFFTSPIFNITAIMTQVTMLLVVCYEFQYTKSGAATYDSVEVVAGKRILLVLVGVFAAAILSMIPEPVTGRVELRKRISKTLADMSKLYGILVGDLLVTYSSDTEPTPNQKKAFRKLALGIRRQIADEQTYLKLSKLEPPMRGKFPFEVYSRLVEKIDNMADLLQGMAYAARSVDKSWQRNLVTVFKQQRMEYLASILSIMKLLSATMASKMALPPFMLSPEELRRRFAEQLSEVITQCPEQLDNATFPSYCAYAVNSYKFSQELEEVIECIEQLVGIEDPEQWLLLHV